MAGQFLSDERAQRGAIAGRRETRFQRMAQAVRALGAARSLDDVVDVARRAARELSGAHGISVVVRDGELCRYVAEDSDFPLWRGQSFPLTVCVSGQAMLGAEQIAIADIYADPRVPHEAYRPTPVRSLVMTPVGDREPQAALGAYWTHLGEPGEEERVVLSALAACMGTALENIKLVDDLRAEAARADALRRESETRLAERVSAEGQIRFQAGLLDAVANAVIATDLTGKVLYWNHASEELYGWTRDEALGRDILSLNAAPGHDAEAADILEALKAGASWSGEIVLRRRDGSTFPALVTDSPLHNARGELIGIVGVSSDMSERHALARHQQLLINELSHRVKNTLAIIQSIARQSFRAGESPGEAREKFEARLQTLSGAHNLLTESGWKAISLRQLIERCMAPFSRSADDARVSLDGPDLPIAPKAAVSLALALHELATNAVKHGALSTEHGRVTLGWSLDAGPAPELRLAWRETGGPPVAAARRAGFGSRLIERGLATELGGAVRLSFPPQGVVCEIDVPAPTLEAIGAPEHGESVFPHLARRTL